MLKRLWCEDEGVLTFEWILLITVLVIGIIGGLSIVRDAINVELANVAAAILSLDQSYTLANPVGGGAGGEVGSTNAACAWSGAVGSAYVANSNKLIGVARSSGAPAGLGSCANLVQ